VFWSLPAHSERQVIPLPPHKWESNPGPCRFGSARSEVPNPRLATYWPRSQRGNYEKKERRGVRQPASHRRDPAPAEWFEPTTAGLQVTQVFHMLRQWGSVTEHRILTVPTWNLVCCCLCLYAAFCLSRFTDMWLSSRHGASSG
jgi:hypothetical protein